jgi:NADPH-dependent 2,4-dienoyl-CoA reductase/sulfur reductase-like enzyme
MRSIAVVGASMAGLYTVEQLRSCGYDGRITLIGAERHLPYDRPPLSKGILTGTRDAASVQLRSAEELAALDVGLRLGVTATGLEPGVVCLADGTAVRADRVVVATGVAARPLPGQPDCEAVRTLRTLDDALWLAERLRRGGTVAVVGAGFIGAEVASATRALGLEVDVIEALDRPMEQALGTAAGELFARLLHENGVRLRMRTRVRGIRDSSGRTVISLSTGEDLAADTVVIGVGAVPNSDWLPDVAPGTGVPCDAAGRVRHLPGVYAVGDVASWPDHRTGVHYRTEHWTSARAQAAIVAADIAGRSASGLVPPDYFWTDQFRHKIQVVGRPELAERSVVVPGPDGALRGSGIAYLRGERVEAFALFGVPRKLAACSALVAAAADEHRAIAALGAAVPDRVPAADASSG